MGQSSRREFLKSSVTTVCAAGLGAAAFGHSLSAAARNPRLELPAPLAIKKGLVFDMLPEKLSYGGRFKLARDVGFEVVQVPTETDAGKAEEIKKAADSAGIRIDSVMNMDHWKYPMSSKDRATASGGTARTGGDFGICPDCRVLCGKSWAGVPSSV